MNYIVIFDVIIIVLGLYLVFSAYKMKRTGEVSSVFFNKEEKGRCRNTEGFIGKMYGKTILFGIVSIVFGVLGLTGSMAVSFGRYFDIGSGVVFLASCLWFSGEIRKGREEFF